MTTGLLFSAKQFCLVSYDVVEDRARLRIMKLLKAHGFRVQKSVFECILSEAQIANLGKRLAKLIDEETDSVRIYRLCGECRGRVEVLGSGEVSEIPLVTVV
ncbi:MAG: CRISPR-associated endonuclease Cas2 [Calditrichaceae bacterium]|nr:CRISPR-associated endonuclease Cas2 [Calditrichia bacterium]NUQ43925.1 CRISPR-associated endonuclease Cas2 [Calditrichaceae bacterium]